jgi:hypothetical protein
MAAQWYVLHVKRRKFNKIKSLLQKRGIPVINPSCIPEYYDDRYLGYNFPEYLFIQIDFDHHDPREFQYMPDTLGLVCQDTTSVVIPNETIESVLFDLARGNKFAEVEAGVCEIIESFDNVP